LDLASLTDIRRDFETEGAWEFGEQGRVDEKRRQKRNKTVFNEING